jgi:hypothetical protein
MSDIVTKSEFAAMVGVTPGRVSQFLSEKKIYGDALIGEGRRARIRSSVAIEQLRRTVDLDRRLGANGRIRLDVPASDQLPGVDSPSASAGPAAAAVPTLDDDIRRQRLQQLELANEKAREEKAARAGLYVKAADVRQELGRVTAHMISIFDGALGEFAAAIAAQSDISARDALHVLRTTFRAIRERQERSEAQSAAELPPLVEDREVEAEGAGTVI